MDQKTKYCKTCKMDHCLKKFLKIIKRKDYSLNSDNDGITLYLKELKTCKDCRTKKLNIYFIPYIIL